MKKIILLITLILLTLISCKKDHNGMFTYEVMIQSPYNQMFLIEYINPKSPDIIFQDMVYYNGLNGLWVLEDAYKDGDYLEITIISMDAMLPILIDMSIIVNGEYVEMFMGDGLTPTTIYYQ